MSTSAGDRTIYLDYAATAPLRPEVWAAMESARADRFNPASSHQFGRRAARRLEDARSFLAESLGCRPDEVVFTGGGTQSNNLAVLGFARARLEEAPRILTSAVEHKATIEAALQAQREGAVVRILPVDENGTLELSALQEELQTGGGPTLVSLMWANNEVGTVQPVAEAAELAQAHGALFHTDAVQAVGKRVVTLEEVPVDLLTATAHKLGGPLGIGLLVKRDGVRLQPITFGASQEASLWPGTQNPVGATGFAAAWKLAVDERPEAVSGWLALRERLADRLISELPEARIHARGADHRLPHLLSVGIPGRDTGALLLALDLEGIAVSAGSACSSSSSAGSAVLEAMGIRTREAYATLRFSFGHGTTEDDVERAADATIRAASRSPMQTAE
jgi:cysteine desulfurase